MSIARPFSVVTAIACLSLVGAALADNGDRPAGSPPSWTGLPTLARAAKPAKSVAITSAGAVGNPAQGTYLLWQDLSAHFAGDAEPLLAALSKALKSKGLSVTKTDAMALEISLGDHHGTVSLAPGPGGGTRVLTCFYNERAPEPSKADCAAIIANEPAQ